MANRKQRRKNKNNSYYNEDYFQSKKKIIITLAVVLFIFGMFYLVTTLVNNSKRALNTTEPEETEVTIQYEEILGDFTFVMPPDEYYVLFYDFNGPSATYYSYIVLNYADIDGNYIYKVDLSNGFNTKFISDTPNSDAQEAGKLQVVDATLIKIKNGKNVSYTEVNIQTIANALE
ncbi:MAG TPA: hypothetical protein PLC53_02090 [Bacilli bacterium]|nr:hypothetical protein [Bacilli bacterium]